tara:strand:+ start:545 stop:709 length:165 start_codon:yes stop_codon:yes gene_type:complete
MKQIHSINPNAILYGTDFPSTRVKVPFSKDDITRVKESFNDSDQEQILYENAPN